MDNQNILEALNQEIERQQDNQLVEDYLAASEEKRHDQMNEALKNARKDVGLALLALVGIFALLIGAYGSFLVSCIMNNVDWFWGGFSESKEIFLASGYCPATILTVFFLTAWAGYFEILRVYAFVKVKEGADNESSIPSIFAGCLTGTGLAVLGVTLFFIGFTLAFPLFLMVTGLIAILFCQVIIPMIGDIPLFFGNLFGIDTLYDLGASMIKLNELKKSSAIEIIEHPIVFKSYITVNVALATLIGLVTCGYKGSLALIGLVIDILAIAFGGGFGSLPNNEFTTTKGPFVANPALNTLYSTALLPIRLIIFSIILCLLGVLVHPMTPEIKRDPEPIVKIEIRKDCVAAYWDRNGEGSITGYSLEKYMSVLDKEDTDECYDPNTLTGGEYERQKYLGAKNSANTEIVWK